MVPPEWIATIVGALLCLVISWFLSAVSHSQGVRLGKVAPTIGIAGALVLAGLAVVGPPHISEFEGVTLMSDPVVIETNPVVIEAGLANEKRRSLMIRTIQKIGHRPDRDHLPYEYSDGTLAWVTKEEYRKLKKGE